VQRPRAAQLGRLGTATGCTRTVSTAVEEVGAERTEGGMMGQEVARVEARKVVA